VSAAITRRGWLSICHPANPQESPGRFASDHGAHIQGIDFTAATTEVVAETVTVANAQRTRRMRLVCKTKASCGTSGFRFGRSLESNYDRS
jgi:hypothetical protein